MDVGCLFSLFQLRTEKEESGESTSLQCSILAQGTEKPFLVISLSLLSTSNSPTAALKAYHKESCQFKQETSSRQPGELPSPISTSVTKLRSASSLYTIPYPPLNSNPLIPSSPLQKAAQSVGKCQAKSQNQNAPMIAQKKDYPTQHAPRPRSLAAAARSLLALDPAYAHVINRPLGRLSSSIFSHKTPECSRPTSNNIGHDM